MKAVVLIGGKGTRLRPLTYTTSKSLLPVANRPFVDRLIARLEAHGVTEIIFALNHLATEMISYLTRQNAGYRARIICSVEPEPLGSAGALKYNEQYLDAGAFLLLNGDILTDLDYSDLLRFHRDRGALVTVDVAQVPDPSRFGVVTFDDAGRVESWREKMPDPPSNWVNVGVWAMEPGLLAHIPPRQFLMLERDIFPPLLQTDAPFYAYRSTGYWNDLGTPASYLQLHRDLLTGKIHEPLGDEGPLPLQQVRAGLWLGHMAQVDPTARLEPPLLIGPMSQVTANVTLIGPLSLGSECWIQHDATIQDSVLLDQTIIERGATVTGSILGRNVQIGEGVTLTNVVIGDDSVIAISPPPGSKLGPGTVLRRDA